MCEKTAAVLCLAIMLVLACEQVPAAGKTAEVWDIHLEIIDAWSRRRDVVALDSDGELQVAGDGTPNRCAQIDASNVQRVKESVDTVYRSLPDIGRAWFSPDEDQDEARLEIVWPEVNEDVVFRMTKFSKSVPDSVPQSIRNLISMLLELGGIKMPCKNSDTARPLWRSRA
jgi:hypothetical protein